MSCKDKKIRNLLCDFVDGELTDSEAARVVQHLETCHECRDSEAEYRMTAAGLRAAFREDAAKHPDNTSLVDFVDDPGRLSVDARKSIELHLAVCPACSEKTKMLRQVAAEEAAASPVSVRRLPALISRTFSPAKMPKVAAAYVTAGLLLMAIAAGYFGWYQPWLQSPRMRFQTATDTIWLLELRRSEQDLPVVREHDGWVTVGIRFTAFFDEETYVVRLRLSDGRIAAERNVDRFHYQSGGIGLRIHTGPLEAGECQIVLAGWKRGDPQSMLESAYPFVLVKPQKGDDR